MLINEFIEIANLGTFVSGKITQTYSSYYLISLAEGDLALCELVLRYNSKIYTIQFACAVKDGYICDIPRFSSNPYTFRGSSVRVSVVIPSLELSVLTCNGFSLLYDRLNLDTLNTYVTLSNIYNNNVCKINHKFQYYTSVDGALSTVYTRNFDTVYGSSDDRTGSGYRVEFSDFVLWGHVVIDEMGLIRNFDYGTTLGLVPIISSDLYRLVTKYNNVKAAEIGIKNNVDFLSVKPFTLDDSFSEVRRFEDWVKGSGFHKVYYSGINGGIYYINHKYRDNVTGEVGYFEGKMLTPPMVAYTDSDGKLKNRYDTISVDYIVKDGIITKDNTEPFQYGLDDMLNLSYVK